MAFFNNHSFLCNRGRYVGVMEGSRTIKICDYVRIEADCNGCIAPGITQEGFGVVAEISNRHTDHYYKVVMENGETGFVRSTCIAEVISRTVARRMSERKNGVELFEIDSSK